MLADRYWLTVSARLIRPHGARTTREYDLFEIDSLYASTIGNTAAITPHGPFIIANALWSRACKLVGGGQRQFLFASSAWLPLKRPRDSGESF